MSWMQATGFSISEKLEITHLTAGDGSLVRGVVVLENMQRGETLCNLPVHLICTHCTIYCLLKSALHIFMAMIGEKLVTHLTQSEIAPSQLNMGLYDNETAVPGEVDAWDRAAARLLREKYVNPSCNSK